jgi:maltose/moltooligosaccharide transporter
VESFTPALTEHVFKAPKPNNAEYAKLDAQGEVLKMMPMKLFFSFQTKKATEYKQKIKSLMMLQI